MLTKEQKMSLVKASIGYSWGGCLTCFDPVRERELEKMIDTDIAGFYSRRSKWSTHHFTCTAGVRQTLEIVGVNLAELDLAFGAKDRETNFATGLTKCVTTDEFLPVVEELIGKQV